MGLILSLSGIIGASDQDVQDGLRQYAAAHGGSFRLKAGTARDNQILVLDSLHDNVSVVYPGDFFEWDDASMWLSERLSRPAFSFHIHDEDLWMFVLFRAGEVITQFNPIPDYWFEDLTEEEIRNWHGDAAAIAACVPGLKAEKIARYLKRWDFDSDQGVKAYPDDQFPFLDCWQLNDFMKRIPLSCPVDADGNTSGTTCEFIVPEKNH